MCVLIPNEKTLQCAERILCEFVGFRAQHNTKQILAINANIANIIVSLFIATVGFGIGEAAL